MPEKLLKDGANEIVIENLGRSELYYATYATFFTITSGEQVFYSSRDCDREGDSKFSKILKPNVVEKSEPGQWLKVYSSSDFQCTENNRPAPKGGAQYEVKVEVSGVVSEKKLSFFMK